MISILIISNFSTLVKRGAYGEVKLAFEKGKESCEKCAIKIIKKNKFTINGRNQMVNLDQYTNYR